MCDPWWENEKPWHREWKEQFPKEWQEVIHTDENGERHIADVKTDHGYVIEFQHSPIKLEERQSREAFYKKMVWVIDGTRRSRDKNKFIDLLNHHSIPVDGRANERRLKGHLDKCALIRDWGCSNAPVLFDFSDDILWCLLPKTPEKRMYIFRIERAMLLASLRPIPQASSFELQLKGWQNLITADENYLRWQARSSIRQNSPYRQRQAQQIFQVRRPVKIESIRRYNK